LSPLDSCSWSLHLLLGEAHYAVRIEAGEIVWTGDGRKFRVDVVPTDSGNHRTSS
jgi:hypothetical protein